ncbi:MAG TPA: hypothetical protein VGG39_22540 [Polyangiaceae bacterium]|jgi:hypothetical protein
MHRQTIASIGTVLIATAWLAPACSSHDSGGPSAEGGAPIDGSAPPTDAATQDVVYDRVPYDGTSPPSMPRVPVYSQVTSNRVDVESLMFAAGEMQISGEPFASGFAGRNLGDYDRNYVPPDQYILDLGGDDPIPVTDLFGFSTAVESYEYSKYYMNMVIQESTAGVSLANGPVVAQLPGAAPLDRLRARMQDLLSNAGTDIGGYATLPAPVNNDQNYLGFPGQWPAFLPFADWDPTMNPTLAVVQSCTYQGGYGGLGFGTSIDPLYECAYNTVHLADRESQVDKVVTPGLLGYATWKQAIWAIDFAGRIHDTCNNQVNTVTADQLPLVGQHGNTVLAQDNGACVGTYIGSSSLEGMWGLTMMATMDNAAEWILGNAITSDGQTLVGFPTKLAALQYDYTSPLAWFPASLKLTEDTTAIPYPLLTGVAITDATSQSTDLAGLLLGNSMYFGTSDPRNVGVGQRVGFQAVFDGDPFPADDGVADGEDTVHDRSLAVIRVAFVDLDRIHVDPASGVVLDTATVTGAGGAVTRGTAVTTTNLAHVIVALRQTVLSINGSITQYGAPDPSPEADLGGILNPLPFHPPASANLDGGAPLFSQRVRQVFLANAAFVRDVLTQADGTVANGATIVGGKATASTDPASLESQTAAARALTEAFLMTGDETYRTRARAVITKLDASFFGPATLLYRQTAGGPEQIDMTPERFAWLQSALRETYKTLYVVGDPVLDRGVLEQRIARVNKLFLNGWDDVNGDQVIDKPEECLGGRLQMGEQALTGELGRDGLGRPTADRDGDCVIEIAHSRSASVQASHVLFTTQPLPGEGDAGEGVPEEAGAGEGGAGEAGADGGP